MGRNLDALQECTMVVRGSPLVRHWALTPAQCNPGSEPQDQEKNTANLTRASLSLSPAAHHCLLLHPVLRFLRIPISSLHISQLHHSTAIATIYILMLNRDSIPAPALSLGLLLCRTFYLDMP